MLAADWLIQFVIVSGDPSCTDLITQLELRWILTNQQWGLVGMWVTSLYPMGTLISDNQGWQWERKLTRYNDIVSRIGLWWHEDHHAWLRLITRDVQVGRRCTHHRVPLKEEYTLPWNKISGFIGLYAVIWSEGPILYTDSILKNPVTIIFPSYMYCNLCPLFNISSTFTSCDLWSSLFYVKK